MAINIYTPFTAPQSIMQGAMALGEGIGGGLSRGAATFFEKMEKEKEKAKEDAKRSKAYDVLGEQLGFNKDKLTTMSLEQKEALIKGTQLKEELEARKQQQQLVAQQIARMQAQEANDSRAAGFYSTLARRAEGGPSNAQLENYYENGGAMPQGRPFGIGDIASSAAESGYNPGAGQFDDIIRAFAPRGQTGWNLSPNDTSNVGGVNRIAVSPNSYQVVNPPKTPDALKENYPWLYSDSEEEVLAHLRTLPPEEMKKAVAARAAIRRMEGGDDPLEDLLKVLGGGGATKPPKGKGVADTSKPSLRFRKNPVTGATEAY